MCKSFAMIGIAIGAALIGQPAQAATCPSGYKVFLNPPTQWQTPGNWSVSKPCCRGSGGDVQIASCVAYAKAPVGKGPVGSQGSSCAPGDAKCAQGHDVRKGGAKGAY